MKQSYHILLKDIGRTFNINMHTYSCQARSKEEAIGKMVVNRPDYDVGHIQKITKGSEVCYVDSEFEQSIKKAKELL